jgi:hypothetical protein
MRVVLAAVAMLCFSCVGVVHGEPSHEPHGEPGVYSYGGCDVPAGHLPPPGECRIWYPDREPGQQPPPGDCSALAHRVPPGACFVGR